MGNVPFLMSPAAKDYLWGGTRLSEEYGKDKKCNPLAETWECSTHPEGQSFVGNIPLGDVLSERPEYLGYHPLQTTGGKPVLPILIKFIDAYKDLSIQVHPDDEYALKNENQLGKTEMWYVIEAQEDSELVYGFNRDVEREEVSEAVVNGTINKLLNHVPVKKNDVFYLEAGTVHAIGAGVLIAEIQEASDITYRLYDYDRVDKNGKKRGLNVKRALDVAKLNASNVPRQPMRVLRYHLGCARELLARCKYFQVERMLINTEEVGESVKYSTGSSSFHALMCIDGCGSMIWNDGAIEFSKGNCIFVPADSVEIKIYGKTQLLDISC